MMFGSAVLPTGGVRFNLWAPSATGVKLCLDPGQNQKILTMQTEADGWFGLETVKAKAGSLYLFRVNRELFVPDPASRFQPRDVHGPSQVVDPGAFDWHDDNWRGRPWEEAVIYEVHIGSFTTAGTFAGLMDQLGYLVDLGVTCLELMPVADFPGQHSWGYDGVFPFAPDSKYGRPEDLRKLVESAHAHNLMVLLDVVYNHFGPEGNYLHSYAAPFFTDRYQTPWGPAINFSGPNSHWVRQFFIENGLYWLEEYHFDGLRLDAVHAIHDNSSPHVLEEFALAVRQHFGTDRHIHLILENDCNEARYLERRPDGRPRLYTAQWNDDFHHTLHVLLTGETQGYYADYAEEPCRHLGRCLAEGFAYQGESSAYRDGEKRGEQSRHLPPLAFIPFLQNHDQVGNRAFGERLVVLTSAEPLQAALAILLLSPSPPLLFMGEEWGCSQPFHYFCDFEPELAALVTNGRHREFARFPQFTDPETRGRIPDPASGSTFASVILDRRNLNQPDGIQWLEFYQHLLVLRHREIIPLLPGIRPGATWQVDHGTMLEVHWPHAEGSRLQLVANLDSQPRPDVPLPPLPCLYATHETGERIVAAGLPPWSVFWFLAPPPEKDTPW